MSSKITDLETIVKAWAWTIFLKTRSKKHSDIQFDDALLEVNWSRVRFISGKPNYSEITTPEHPTSQVVFKSVYVNNTSKQQENSFKTERTTSASCTTTITNGYTKGVNLDFKLALPGEIAEATVGFGREVNIESTDESTTEKSLTWSVDSAIAVPAKTKTVAELVVKEQELYADFNLDVTIKGRVLVVITNLRDNNSFVQSIESDFTEIMKKEQEKGKKGFIIENKKVMFPVHGKCSFRYGVEQHVQLNEESMVPVTKVEKKLEE